MGGYSQSLGSGCLYFPSDDFLPLCDAFAEKNLCKLLKTDIQLNPSLVISSVLIKRPLLQSRFFHLRRAPGLRSMPGTADTERTTPAT